jgi:hypothetical protein
MHITSVGMLGINIIQKKLYKAIIGAVVNQTLIGASETLGVHMCLFDKYVQYTAGIKAHQGTLHFPEHLFFSCMFEEIRFLITQQE